MAPLHFPPMLSARAIRSITTTAATVRATIARAVEATEKLIFAGTALLALPAAAQEHRFEDDPVVTIRENFVACDVLSQLQRVMDDPRSLLFGECVPLRAGDRVRIYVRRGPYACIYPYERISPCKWTHEKALARQAKRKAD